MRGQWICASALSLLLISCGGGSGGGSEPATGSGAGTPSVTDNPPSSGSTPTPTPNNPPSSGSDSPPAGGDGNDGVESGGGSGGDGSGGDGNSGGDNSSGGTTDPGSGNPPASGGDGNGSSPDPDAVPTANLSMRLDRPQHVAADNNGNVYVVDGNRTRIRRIGSDGNASTLTQEEGIVGLVATNTGDIFYSVPRRSQDGTRSGSTIRRISGTGAPTDIASQEQGLGTILAMAIVKQSGDLVVIESGEPSKVKRVKQDGTVTELFQLNTMLYYDIAAHGDTIWISHRGLRGTITFYRWSGQGSLEYVATQDPEMPGGMIATESGVYFTKYNVGRADFDNTRCTINRLDAQSGAIANVAGDPAAVCGYREGDQEAALFSFPSGITIGSDGNLYVADYANHVIRRITPTGEVTLFAGAPGQAGGSN